MSQYSTFTGKRCFKVRSDIPARCSPAMLRGTNLSSDVSAYRSPAKHRGATESHSSIFKSLLSGEINARRPWRQQMELKAYSKRERRYYVDSKRFDHFQFNRSSRNFGTAPDYSFQQLSFRKNYSPYFPRTLLLFKSSNSSAHQHIYPISTFYHISTLLSFFFLSLQFLMFCSSSIVV